jgi:hypothetical protein
MHPNSQLLLDNRQTIVLFFGSLAPLLAYVLNKKAPWISEPVKAAIQVIVAAAVGALTIALDNGTLALDRPTLQLVGSAVLAALVAHNFFFKPASINRVLGAVETEPKKQ